MRKNTIFSLLSVLMLIIGLAIGCGGGGSSTDSGGGTTAAASYDTVANAQGPAFLKVINDLSTGLDWTMIAYGFGANMKPGECTIFGVAVGTITMLT